MAEKNTLKQWFVTGAKPLQAQYWSWLDSYWHKSESIPINKIEGLETLIENKADVEELANYAKVDASNIGPNQGAWRTALGINDITPPDVDLSNYYTMQEVDDLLENVTVDLSNYYTAAQTESAITSKGYITAAALTGYATENWVSTQTTPATQTEVEASTGTESNPTSAELATENRKFLTLFNFFKLIKKLRYIYLLPNSETAVANRLRSDGSNLYFANGSAVESKLLYDNEGYISVTGDVTVDNSYHGRIVRVSANCNITLSSTLRNDFIAYFVVIGNYTIIFVEGSGVTFYAPYGKKMLEGNTCYAQKSSGTKFDLIGTLTPA